MTELGEYRLAKRVDGGDDSKSPYVIPVVTNWLIRSLLICMIASIMATGYLILFGSVTGRSIKSLTGDNNVILCGMAQDDIQSLKAAGDPKAYELEKACKRLTGE